MNSPSMRPYGRQVFICVHGNCAGPEKGQQLQQRVDNLPFEQFCQDHAVFAEPSACIDRLQAIREEFDLSQIICWFDQGCMLPVDEVKRCMALFADTVMPKLS